MHELAGIQKARGHVFGNLGAALGQDALAGGHQNMHQHQLCGHHDDAEIQHRPRQPEGGKAGGLHDHKFAFLHQAVDDINGGREGRHRQDQPDHVRQGQHGKLQKHQRGLAVADQLVEQAHGPVHPVDRHQHQREKAEKLQKL